MARKTLKVTLPDTEGRDAGKNFLITEMPPRVGHQWATRAIFGLMNVGVTIPAGLETAGFAAIAAVGIQALQKLPYAVAGPLLDELLQCVQYTPSPNTHRALIDDDVEEVLSLFKLQKEALLLHINFSMPVSPSISE